MAPSLRLGVLASGRGSDLQSLVDAAKAGKIRSRVAAVVSDNADARALDRARTHDIPAYAVVPDASKKGPDRKADHEDRMVAALRQHQVDLVVLAGYMRLVSPRFLAAFPDRVVNIHPALLPAFPGLHAQKQALDWGVRVAGCTTHFVDAETDHGPILLQAAVSVAPDETEDTLSRRILGLEHQILPRTVHLLEQGRARLAGRRVVLDPDESWTRKYPVMDGALYAHGY